MSFSIYTASIPVFIHNLKSLAALLKKAHENAASRKFDFAVLLDARLAPDMHKLTRQIQIVSDTVKNGAARLAGIEAPSFPDTETTYEQLQERIAKTIAFLEPITETQLEGADTRSITLKFPNIEHALTFTGAGYLTSFVLPNLFFHMTTTYNILRHNGVPLGKRDFMGA